MNTRHPVPTSGIEISSAPAQWPKRKTRTAHRRLRHAVDRSAGVVVWVGGIATIVSIMGIFLYLMWEVIPLFRSTSGDLVATVQVHEARAFPSNTTVIGSDEYQEVVFVLAGKRLQLLRMPQGTPVPEVGGMLEVSGTVQSSVLIGQKGNRVSVATQEGMVMPVTITFRPLFEGNSRTIMPHSQIGEPLRVIPEGEELVHHAHTQQDERQVIAAVTGSGDLWLTQMEEPGEFSFSDEVTITQRQLKIPEQTTITHMVLDSFGRRLVAGTKQGELLEWLLKDGADAKVRRVAVGEPGEAITALTYLLGERTLIVGTQAGSVMTWVPMNERKAPSPIPFRKVTRFRPIMEQYKPSLRLSGIKGF